MRSTDIILFAVIFLSMACAVMFPATGTPVQPYILHCMMLFLFLNFLRLDFRALVDASPSKILRLGGLVAVKLVVLPAVLYWVTLWVFPEYALPVLLLSGISTGVVAPFMATLVAADVLQVLRMVIITSFLVPFSLPALVKVLAGAEITISMLAMVKLLAMVVFLPMAAVVILRRIIPGILEWIAVHQFPILMALFAIINLGVFSKYSSFFFGNPGQLMIAVGVAYVLSGGYYASGFLITPGRKLPERLAAGVSFGAMNNVLVIVFSSAFFGPLCPTLAAMYMFPFYTMIVPVRLIANFIGARGSQRTVGS